MKTVTPKDLSVELFGDFLKRHSYGSLFHGFIATYKSLQPETETMGLWLDENLIICDFKGKEQREFYGSGLMVN